MQDSKVGRLNKGTCLRKEPTNDKADEVVMFFGAFRPHYSNRLPHLSARGTPLALSSQIKP